MGKTKYPTCPRSPRALGVSPALSGSRAPRCCLTVTGGHQRVIPMRRLSWARSRHLPPARRATIPSDTGWSVTARVSTDNVVRASGGRRVPTERAFPGGRTRPPGCLPRHPPGARSTPGAAGHSPPTASFPATAGTFQLRRASPAGTLGRDVLSWSPDAPQPGPSAHGPRPLPPGPGPSQQDSDPAEQPPCGREAGAWEPRSRRDSGRPAAGTRARPG